MTIHDLLGHRLITSTQIYLHVTADDLRAAAARHPMTNVSPNDVFVGRNFWTNASPSRVAIYVTAKDGHAIPGVQTSLDGLPPGPPKDTSEAVLDWCFLLPPGYSYSSTVALQSVVPATDLRPGNYQLKAIYSSYGIDYNVHSNPLLARPELLKSLLRKSWKGDVGSNKTEFIIFDKGLKGVPFPPLDDKLRTREGACLNISALSSTRKVKVTSLFSSLKNTRGIRLICPLSPAGHHKSDLGLPPSSAHGILRHQGFLTA